MTKPKSLGLLVNLLDTVDKLGVDTANSILDEGRDRYHKAIDGKIEFIVKATSKLFNIPKDELLYSRTKYDRTEALAICFYVTSKKLQINGRQIAKTFKKNFSQVSRGMKRIRNLDPSHPVDKVTKERLTIIMDQFDKEYFD